MRISCIFTFLFVIATCAPAVSPVHAWTRPGHMVTAAIAYEDLMATDPALVDQIVEIMSAHPEPGPFEVAIGRAEGGARKQRIFFEIARWADDIRRSEYDHPTWHYRFRPIEDPLSPPPKAPPYAASGSAFEALALNMSVAQNPKASTAERAVALCWIFHIVGDIHQPLHTAELFSSRWPDGDNAGGRAYLIDPDSKQVVNLHWFWDDAVHRQAEPEAALARARDLMTRFPRSHFAAGFARDGGRPAAIEVWEEESYQIARSLAYRPDAPRAATVDQAVLPTKPYIRDSKGVAEQRITIAGYRLANLLRSLFVKDTSATQR